jgi:hypothetical protein
MLFHFIVFYFGIAAGERGTIRYLDVIGPYPQEMEGLADVGTVHCRPTGVVCNLVLG